MRAPSGFCFAGAAMIVESWLNERASRENRGTIFSIYQMVNFAASTAGQLSLAITSADRLLLLRPRRHPLLRSRSCRPRSRPPQHPRPLKTTRLDIRRLYATSPVSAVGCVLIGMVNGAFGTLGAVYGERIDLPTANVAFLMAGAVLGGALIQFPLGRLSDRMDRRKVLIGVAVARRLRRASSSSSSSRARRHG